MGGMRRALIASALVLSFAGCDETNVTGPDGNPDPLGRTGYIQISIDCDASGRSPLLCRATTACRGLYAFCPGFTPGDVTAGVEWFSDNPEVARVVDRGTITAVTPGDTVIGMRLLGAFAGVAMLLAAIGLYGVMASVMSERTREIALRLALGATPARVMRMVIRQLAIMATAGIATGLVIALVATRHLQPLLFGVTRTDATTYGVTALLLVVVTMLSGYVPARLVTRIDPVEALRSE